MNRLSENVYGLLKRVPEGKVTTYAEIAVALGNRNLARVVGNALNRNPDIVVVPCHRVVKSDGSVGGYRLGVLRKVELLEKEGITVKGGMVSDLKAHLFRFR